MSFDIMPRHNFHRDESPFDDFEIVVLISVGSGYV